MILASVIQRTRYSAMVRSLTLLAALLLAGPAAEARLARNAEERAVARLVTKHPQQGRSRMTYDAHLHLVARAKARDMARRDYFGHMDPDGYWPNHVVALTGYGFPDHYGGPNNIESITAGTNYTPRRAMRAWLKSRDHRPHLLATNEFYEAQTRYGVGYARSSRSRYKHYYVFLSAPPSTSPPGALTKTIRRIFLNKTPRQIESSRMKRR